MEHHDHTQAVVAAVTGSIAAAVPEEILNWFQKVILGVSIALISAFAHGIAKYILSRLFPQVFPPPVKKDQS